MGRPYNFSESFYCWSFSVWVYIGRQSYNVDGGIIVCVLCNKPISLLQLVNEKI